MKADDNRGNQAVTMITKLVSNDNNNSFKLLLCYIFLEDIKYINPKMTSDADDRLNKFYIKAKIEGVATNRTYDSIFSLQKHKQDSILAVMLTTRLQLK